MGRDRDSSLDIRLRFNLDFSVVFLLKVGLLLCSHVEILESANKKQGVNFDC